MRAKSHKEIFKMKKTNSIILVAGILMLSFIVSVPVWAANDGLSRVMTILKKTKEVFEPERSSIRKVVISVGTAGETVQWVAGQAFKKFPDGNRMLIVMIAPNEVKGMAFLVWEQENKPDVMWVYLPTIRRVKKIAGLIDRNASFFGTDFTYADLGFIRLHKNYQLFGKEEHAGMKAYKVEEKMPEASPYYLRIITWIATDSLLPLQRDYYAPSGDLWKTESFENVSVIEGVPVALRIEMKDVKGNTSTELTLSEVDYDVDIPDAVFYPKQLSQVAAHPLWQPYCAHLTKEKQK